MAKELEIVEIEVEKGVNEVFYMGHLSTKIKFNANKGCVMSLKWLHKK
jgi:hypothetical protein